MTNSINKLYNQIVSLDNYRPSPKVNYLFTELVAQVLKINKSPNLSIVKKIKLQEICAQAEYELEKYWAEKIINSENSVKTFAEFPYLNNYEKLTKIEWFSLLSCTRHKRHRVIFTGGGPLPMTAIILAQRYQVKLTVIDIDRQACDLARQVIEKFNLADKIRIMCSDASEFKYYSSFNVIFVAALAGVNTQAKKVILEKIKKDAKLDTHILARSSWGMREILYQPLDRELYRIFKPELEIKPLNDVINSLVIFSNK